MAPDRIDGSDRSGSRFPETDRRTGWDGTGQGGRRDRGGQADSDRQIETHTHTHTQIQFLFSIMY